MGITIRYHGRVSPKVTHKVFYSFASILCREKKWNLSPLEEKTGTSMLIQPDGEIPYTGALASFVVDIHEHCEPLMFQITSEGFFQNWCKTQFAPIEVHMGIVDFFAQMKSKCSELVIQDEGGYWESRDAEALEERIVNCFLEMQKSKEDDPEYYGPVKSEDGRITDLIK